MATAPPRPRSPPGLPPSRQPGPVSAWEPAPPRRPFPGTRPGPGGRRRPRPRRRGETRERPRRGTVGGVAGAPASTTPASSAARLPPEDLRELERRRRLELIVATGFGAPVGAPADEAGRVPEPVALEVIVGDLGDPLHAQRLPREVLAAIPARRCPRHPSPIGGLGQLGGRPVAPRVAIERAVAQRRQLVHELAAASRGEPACDTDVME